MGCHTEMRSYSDSAATPILGPYLIRRLQHSKACQALAFRLGRDPSKQEERLTHSKEACPKMEESAPSGVSFALRPPTREPARPWSCTVRPGRRANGSCLNFLRPSRSLGREARERQFGDAKTTSFAAS